MDTIMLEQQGITGQQLDKGSPPPLGMGDHSWKFNFFIESGLKMIQFKTKSKIFIQLSTENLIELFIQKNLRKNIQN